MDVLLSHMRDRFTEQDEINAATTSRRGSLRSFLAIPILQRIFLSGGLRRGIVDFLEHMFINLWIRLTEQNKDITTATAWGILLWSVVPVPDLQHRRLSDDFNHHYCGCTVNTSSCFSLRVFVYRFHAASFSVQWRACDSCIFGWSFWGPRPRTGKRSKWCRWLHRGHFPCLSRPDSFSAGWMRRQHRQ